MEIDISFNFYSDSKEGDPDSKSPTLRLYHKILWSKQLPNGQNFDLIDNKDNVYLYHKSSLGEYFLGSDAITHSYKHHKRKFWITKQLINEVNELFNLGSNIGAYIIFPNNQVDGKYTINQARGVNKLIDDRFDLTLECIRLFYLGKNSPLYDTLLRYRSFFELFENFNGYITFFLLEDLIDENQNIKFYLPFDDFNTPPMFSNPNQYRLYKEKVTQFITARNNRIHNYASHL